MLENMTRCNHVERHMTECSHEIGWTIVCQPTTWFVGSKDSVHIAPLREKSPGWLW